MTLGEKDFHQGAGKRYRFVPLPITPPLRGSRRDQGAARGRAGGGPPRDLQGLLTWMDRIYRIGFQESGVLQFWASFEWKNIDPRGPDRCPPHRIPWERGRDARMLFLWRLLSFPAMLQAVILSAPHRPGRNKAMAPFPVDSSEGDGRGCAWLCAGGTPALPGSTHLMTSPHQGHHPAEAVWRRLSMEEVHLHSCLFVSIRVHSCPFVVHLH